MTAIGHHKRAAGAGIIVRIGERRLSAPNPSLRQIDAVPCEGQGWTEFDAAADGRDLSELA